MIHTPYSLIPMRLVDEFALRPSSETDYILFTGYNLLGRSQKKRLASWLISRGERESDVDLAENGRFLDFGLILELLEPSPSAMFSLGLGQSRDCIVFVVTSFAAIWILESIQWTVDRYECISFNEIEPSHR